MVTYCEVVFSNSQFFSIDQCPGEHEVFVNCTGCQPTCLNPNNTENCSVPCIPGCICIPGYLRNDTGICVPQEQCGPITQPPCDNSTTTSTEIIPTNYVRSHNNELHYIQKEHANKRRHGVNQKHARHYIEKNFSGRHQNIRHHSVRNHEDKQHEAKHHETKHHEVKNHDAKHHEAKYQEAEHHETKYHERELESIHQQAKHLEP